MLLVLSQYTPPSSAPDILSLNGAGNTLAHGQACTVAGLQFTGTPGTITLRQGALSQVQSSGVTWADTSIAFTANTSIFAYGPLVLEITNANGTDQHNVTLIPVAGKGWITADVPWDLADYSVFEGASPAVADGDQLEYDLLTDNAANVTMFADGTFSIDETTQDHSFDVRVFDQTDKTWSAAVTISVNATLVITIVDPVDGDGVVVRGQVGAVILGDNFGVVAGTVSIGGALQTVQSWANDQITIIVAPATPLGPQPLVVDIGVATHTVTVTVAAVAGAAPVFVGPQVSIAEQTQNVAASPVNVSARFVEPLGQSLVYSAVGAWPPGLAVTSASGVIQGIPTTAGTFDGLAIRATGPTGLYADSNTISIVVAPPAVVPTPQPTPSTPPIGGSGVSDVAIVNLALTKLGEARITSLDDDLKPARTMKAIYEMIRDAELRRRKWRFSIRRTALPALTETPAFGYANAYQLPADCLKILMVGDMAPGVDLSDVRTGFDTELYSLEGRQILTDLAAPLSLRYQSRVTDPTQFDATFVAALASRLAYEACEDLTQSSSKKQDAANDYRTAIREAVAANAIEVAPTPLADDSWLLSRH